MGHRQHPGPLLFLCSAFLTFLLLLAGCAETPLPGSSAIGSPAVQAPTDLPPASNPPAPESPSSTAPASATLPPPPVPETAPSPIILGMESTGPSHEPGPQARRSGDTQRVGSGPGAALATSPDTTLRGQPGIAPLGPTKPSAEPPSPRPDTLATPPPSATPGPAAPSDEEAEEPALDAPALLGPEDQEAVTEPQPGETPPLPEPDTAKHDIPVVFNKQVKTFLHHFQTQKWGVITRAFGRASRYLPMMRQVFREKGLPEDLLNLAFIESAVNPWATSRVKAAGIWQFMPDTGRLYGMQVSWWRDERRDPEKSTRGAAEYLKRLYEMFEDWPLALAAYNAGEGKIQAAITRQRTRDFWALRLPRETRLFVPAFMAMTIISREPEQYGFSPPPDAPFEIDAVPLQHPTELQLIARSAGATVEEIRELNPELIRWATPPTPPDCTVRIPAGRRDAFLEALEQVPPSDRVTWIRHKVKRGETTTTIARRYGMDASIVLEVNGLPKRQTLKAGGTVLVPASAVGTGSVYAMDARKAKRPPARSKSSVRYTVKKGDTLAGIARAHAVSTEDLRRWNNLSRDAALRPGQTLTIRRPPRAKVVSSSAPTPGAASRPKPAKPASKRYVVKPGDTLWTIARIHAVSPEDLRRWNKLSRDAAIRPGQELRVSPSL